MRRIILSFFILSLSACTLAPDYERPAIDAGANWKDMAAPEASANNEPPVSPAWWQDYQSGVLNQLVPKALAGNNDLLAGFQRIEQARAAVTKSEADLFPQVSASASQTKDRQERSGIVTRSDGNNIGFSVSYEVDLFGRIRSGAAAAQADYEASRFDHESLKIITAAAVVEAYAQALAMTERLRVADDNLAIAKDVLSIIDARSTAGTASDLELSQQKAAVASAQAAMAALAANHDGFLNQLAVLLGEAPQNFRVEEENFSALIAPKIVPGLPARLLQQRPDIRRAEASLMAANADIGVARAAFFPSLTLDAAGILSGNPASTLLSLGASALAPLFRGGALESDLEITKARKEELAANYRQTVLTAFQESGNALSALRAADSRAALLADAAAASRNAYKLARSRYDSGSIDFQTLLDTQRTLLQAEDSATQARLEQISASVDLTKALGGGWNDPGPVD
ncbi:MAG: efflux transporter outer membrane subunit [Alphaproteobacteria bacterium]